MSPRPEADQSPRFLQEYGEKTINELSQLAASRFLKKWPQNVWDHRAPSTKENQVSFQGSLLCRVPISWKTWDSLLGIHFAHYRNPPDRRVVLRVGLIAPDDYAMLTTAWQQDRELFGSPKIRSRRVYEGNLFDSAEQRGQYAQGEWTNSGKGWVFDNSQASRNGPMALATLSMVYANFMDRCSATFPYKPVFEFMHSRKERM